MNTKISIAVLAFALLVMTFVVTPAMALGPVKAIEKNPLLSDFDDCSLEPPNHVWLAWTQDGVIKHWIPAKPSGKA